MLCLQFKQWSTPILNFKNWKASLLLSIIIPMSLLATFRITGVLQGPIMVSEVETLETIVWKTEKPHYGIRMRWMNGLTSVHDGEIKLFQEVVMADYEDLSFYGSDLFHVGVNMTASTSNGYIHSICLDIADKEHVEARIMFWSQSYFTLQNLSIVSSKGLAREVQTAFMDLAGINHSTQVSLVIPFYWILYGPFNQTDILKVHSEVTYYNGSAYNKIVQPFEIIVEPDNNNSFQTATEVNEGNYTRLYLGFSDSVDYYKIFMNQSDRVKLNIETVPDEPKPYFAVYICDFENKKTILQTEQDSSSKIVEFTANSTGYLYIKLCSDIQHGFYSMEISR